MMDIERCHYCGRLAPEIDYEGISICTTCMDELGGEWGLFDTGGNYQIIQMRRNGNPLSWTLIARGKMGDMLARMNDLAGER